MLQVVRLLLTAGAEAVIVCQVKPMQVVDVRPYNDALDRYLWTQDGTGFGVETQIQLDFLWHDGYHVRNQFSSVIDRTYACAIQGVPVLCPTEDFVPDYIKKQWNDDWPGLSSSARAQPVRDSEGRSRVHGWKWC